MDRTARKAYSRMRLPDGRLVDGPLVVETDDDGHIVLWHRLEGEEPFTEWVGGTCTPPPGTEVREKH